MPTIDVVALKRAWAGQRSGVMRILVTGELADGFESVEELEDSSGFYSDAVAKEGLGPVEVREWVQVPEGWSGVMVWPEKFDAVMAWCEGFERAFRLSEGTVTAGPRSREPFWIPDPVMSGVALYAPVDRLPAVPPGGRRPRVRQPQGRVEFLCEQAVGWAYVRGAGQYLVRDIDWEVLCTGLGLENALAQAVERGDGQSVVTASRRPPVRREVEFQYDACVQHRVPYRPEAWGEDLDLVTRGLLVAVGDLDTGWVTIGRRSPNFTGHRIDRVWNYAASVVRPLFDRFVPDAAGVMVLTAAHLERVHDVSLWAVTVLPNGRYLLRARDLDAWFHGTGTSSYHGRYGESYGPQPDQATLTAARVALGDALLTPQAAIDHNPWPPDGHAHRRVNKRANELLAAAGDAPLGFFAALT